MISLYLTRSRTFPRSKSQLEPGSILYETAAHQMFLLMIILASQVTITQQAAAVSASPIIYFPAYSPPLSFTPYGTLAMQNYWMTPYQLPVYPSCVPFVPSNISQYVSPTAV